MATKFGQFSIEHDENLEIFLPTGKSPRRELTYDFNIQNHIALFGTIDYNSTDASKAIASWVQFIQTAGKYEETRLRSRGDQGFNTSQLNVDLVRPFAVFRPNIAQRVSTPSVLVPTSTAPGNVYSNLTTGYIALSYAIFYVSNVLAHSETARYLINTKAGRGYKIPRILMERLQTIRRSRPGGYQITPSLSGQLPNSWLQLLNFKDTLLDTDFITSQEGINALFSWFTSLERDDNNYIHFVAFQQCIDWDGGFTSMGTSISAATLGTQTTPGINNLLSPNSFGQMKVNGVQLIDVFLYNSRLLEGKTPFDTKGNSYDFEDTTDLLQKSMYIFTRVVGDISNRSTSRNDDKPQSRSPKGRGKGKDPKGDSSPSGSSQEDLTSPSTGPSVPKGTDGLAVHLTIDSVIERSIDALVTKLTDVFLHRFRVTSIPGGFALKYFSA